MYNLVFAFIYHLNSRGRGDDPRGVANMVLSLFQFLHFFLILSISIYFWGLTRNDFSQLSGASPAIYGIVSLLPFYIFNSVYYKGKRVERVVNRYDQKRVFELKNIILIILLFILPIILLAVTSEIRHYPS